MKRSLIDSKYFRDVIGGIISIAIFLLAIYINQSGGGEFSKPLIKFLWVCGSMLGVATIADVLAQKVFSRTDKNIS